MDENVADIVKIQDRGKRKEKYLSDEIFAFFKREAVRGLSVSKTRKT